MVDNLMARMLADAPTAHDDGHFISAKVSRIVELIRQYDDRLDVAWVPPEYRQEGDAAFAITERIADGRTQVVMYVNSEEEMNESVLARIYESDVENNDVLGKIEANNRAVRNAEALRRRDEMEEAHDLLHTVLKSPKHNFTHDGKTYRK